MKVSSSRFATLTIGSLQIILTVLATFCLQAVLAAPAITGISPPLGRPGDIVRVNGTGFDPVPAKNVVHFGPNRAAVLLATGNQVTVQVPNGQPLGPAVISVSGVSGPTFNTVANSKLANVPPNPASGSQGCGCRNRSSSSFASWQVSLGAVLGGAVGNIYGHTGEVFQLVTDLIIPGRPGADPAVEFSVEREYRSAATTNGPLGPKWEQNYFQNLEVQVDGSVIHHNLGRNDRYLVNNQGNFVAPPEFYTSLVRNQDGSYTLTYNDHTAKEFDQTGKLRSIRDRNGNSITFSYNGMGQLATVA